MTEWVGRERASRDGTPFQGDTIITSFVKNSRLTVSFFSYEFTRSVMTNMVTRRRMSPSDVSWEKIYTEYTAGCSYFPKTPDDFYGPLWSNWRALFSSASCHHVGTSSPLSYEQAASLAGREHLTHSEVESSVRIHNAVYVNVRSTCLRLIVCVVCPTCTLRVDHCTQSTVDGRRSRPYSYHMQIHNAVYAHGRSTCLRLVCVVFPTCTLRVELIRLELLPCNCCC